MLMRRLTAQATCTVHGMQQRSGQTVDGKSIRASRSH